MSRRPFPAGIFQNYRGCMRSNVKILLPLVSLSLLCACHKAPPAVTPGAKVTLSCTLSTAGIPPVTRKMSCEQGHCGLPPMLEDSLLGKTEGQNYKLSLPKEKSFPYIPQYVRDIPTSQLPKDGKPTVGQPVQASTQDGRKFVCVITAVTKQKITVDCNNPFAGKPLDCDVTIVAVGK